MVNDNDSVEIKEMIVNGQVNEYKTSDKHWLFQLCEKYGLRIAASLIGALAGILPLVWLFVPSLVVSKAYDTDITKFALVSSVITIPLLLMATVFLFFVNRWHRKASEHTTVIVNGYKSFGLAVAFEALLILRLLMHYFASVNRILYKIMNYFPDQQILELFTTIVYVLLFVSCIRAYPSTRKLGRILLISGAVCFAVSFSFGIVNTNSRGSDTRPFNLYQLGYWDSFIDYSDLLLLYTVAVPLALGFFFRALALPFRTLDMRATSKALNIKVNTDMNNIEKPKQISGVLVAFCLVLPFLFAFATNYYIHKPMLDLTTVCELGMTYREIAARYKKDEIKLEKDTIWLYHKKSRKVSSKECGFDKVPINEDSICISVTLNKDALFLNLKSFYEYWDKYSLDSSYDFPSILAKEYSLEYLGMTMCDYSELPTPVFQSKEYRFYYTSKLLPTYPMDIGQIFQYGGFIVITNEPYIDKLAIPEIKINSEEQWGNLYPPRYLYVYDVFNGLVESGNVSSEEFAEMYHLKTDPEEVTLFHGEDRNYKIELKGNIITPFSCVTILDPHQ